MLTAMSDFDAFIAELATLPPMGASNTQSDVEFWREIDAMQSKEAIK